MLTAFQRLWTLLVLSACVSALLGTGCHSVAPRGSANDQQQVHDTLMAELRRVVPAEQLPPAPEGIDFTRQPSRVVPGLYYHWALYAPPATSHVLHRVVAATRAGKIRIIRTAGDWNVIAQGWSAESADHVLSACAEIAHVTSDGRLPGFLPIVFTGVTSLKGVPVPDSAFLAERLGPPSVHRSEEGEWVARFWAIEPADVKQYECQLTPQTALTTLQVIPNYGTIRPF